METIFTKLKPKVINYREYKMFSNDTFKQNILTDLSMENFIANYSGLLYQYSGEVYFCLLPRK